MHRADLTSENKTYFPFLLLGHLSFIVLFALSFLFFKERIFFSDTAFQFFKIVNFEKINVEASRYGAILPELPVLLAMKLGVNLKGLTIIYSGSFILLYYIAFICCVYLFKNVPAGLAIVIVLILCISQSFFHPVTETHQSLVFSILVYAILQYSGFRYSIIQYLLAIALIVLAFFTHPVAVYPLVFIIGYVAIDKKQLRSFAPYVLLLIVAILAIGKVLLTSENSYEGKFFSELLKSPSLILDLPHAYSAKFFLKRISGLYFWLAIFELALIVYLVSKKHYVKLGWQLASSGFFLIITILTYNRGDSDMLMERAFMPLALFVALPLLKETIEDKKFRIPKVIFLAVVILISMNRIYQQGRKFRERTQFNLEMLSKTAHIPNRKFIVERSEMEKHHLTFWSHSFETLMLSAITKNMPTQTIFPASDVNKLTKYTTGNNDVFLGTDFWLVWSINDLNHKYFNLPTNYPYKIINIDDLN